MNAVVALEEASIGRGASLGGVTECREESLEDRGVGVPVGLASASREVLLDVAAAFGRGSR